nr:hypothetical protein [Gemmatimonadaceae bacterium]
IATTIGTILVTEGDAQLLHPHLLEWIPDVRLSQPMFALAVDGGVGTGGA